MPLLPGVILSYPQKLRRFFAAKGERRFQNAAKAGAFVIIVYCPPPHMTRQLSRACGLMIYVNTSTTHSRNPPTIVQRIFPEVAALPSSPLRIQASRKRNNTAFFFVSGAWYAICVPKYAAYMDYPYNCARSYYRPAPPLTLA